MDESKLTGFGLLGLHRLVASRGDGLVPELYDALMREALWREDHPNVVKFPAWATRRPGDAAETRAPRTSTRTGPAFRASL